MADYTIQINAEDKTKGTFNNVEAGLGRMTASAGKFKAAIGAAGAAIAAFGVGSAVKGAIDDFDNLAKAARAAGATASGEAFEGFQVMKTALAEAGVDASTADRAFLNISQRMKEGSEGGKAFAEVFEKMRAGVVDSNGALKSSPEILQAMINALNDGTISADEFQKVVGGRAGPVIAQQFASLQDGASGLAATLADVKENANIVPLGAAEQAEVFNDTIGRLGMQLQQLLTDAITPLLPHLTRFAEELLANMPAIVDGVTEAFTNLQPAFELIGRVLTDLVFPIMQKVFEILGQIAEAITPFIDYLLPHMKEGFDFLSNAIQFVYDKMKPVYETAIPALRAGFDGIVAIVQQAVNWFNTAAGAIQGVYDKAMSLKNGVTGAFSSMSNSVTNSAKDMYNGATGYATQLYNDWWGGSIFPDLRDGVLSAFTDMRIGAIHETQMMTQGATAQAATFGQSFQQGFVGTLQSALQDGKLEMSEFRGFFQNTMQQLIGQAFQGGGGIQGAFSEMFGGLGGIFQNGLSGLLGQFSGFGNSLGGILGGIGGMFGGGGGGLGGLFGGIGKLFGGFFANGGYLPSGRFGIVGEEGPEIVTGPANITPMNQMGGGTVVFNINAIDTSNATQFILDNRKQIEGVIQNAYNRRGQRGIV